MSEEMNLMPAILPFGEDILLTASGVNEGIGMLFVRPVRDDMVGSADPKEAWDATGFDLQWTLTFANRVAVDRLIASLTRLRDDMREDAA